MPFAGRWLSCSRHASFAEFLHDSIVSSEDISGAERCRLGGHSSKLPALRDGSKGWRAAEATVASAADGAPLVPVEPGGAWVEPTLSSAPGLVGWPGGRGLTSFLVRERPDDLLNEHDTLHPGSWRRVAPLPAVRGASSRAEAPLEPPSGGSSQVRGWIRGPPGAPSQVRGWGQRPPGAPRERDAPPRVRLPATSRMPGSLVA